MTLAHGANERRIVSGALNQREQQRERGEGEREEREGGREEREGAKTIREDRRTAEQ